MYKCVWVFCCVFQLKSQKLSLVSTILRVRCCMWSKSRAKERSSHTLSLSGMMKNFSVSDENDFFFHCESDWVLTQVAQRSCRLSIFGDLQKLSGHDPGQLSVDGPAWAEWWDQMLSRGPSKSTPICDSIKFYLSVQSVSQSVIKCTEESFNILIQLSFWA